MQLVCVCGYVCCLNCYTLNSVAVFICTLIFKINRMHTCIPVVCICVWEGGGCGVGWGGVVMWVCKREIDVWVMDVYIYIVILMCVCVINS